MNTDIVKGNNLTIPLHVSYLTSIISLHTMHLANKFICLSCKIIMEIVLHLHHHHSYYIWFFFRVIVINCLEGVAFSTEPARCTYSFSLASNSSIYWVFHLQKTKTTQFQSIRARACTKTSHEFIFLQILHMTLVFVSLISARSLCIHY